MGLAKKYFKNMSNAPERDIELSELNGIQRYWYVIKNNFWSLIFLNIIFALSCIPIITIPAAFAALSRICMKYLTGMHVEPMKDYFTELKNTIGRSWLIVLFVAVMFGLLTLACFAYYFLLDGIILNIFLIISLVLALWLFSILCYAFSFQALVELNMGALLKNAVLVSVTELWTTVLLIILPGVVYFLCALFFPLTLPLLVFGIVSLIQLAICDITLDPIKKYAM